MITVEQIIENEDGSADVSFNIGQEELLTYAKIGLLKVLVDSTNDVVNNSVVESPKPSSTTVADLRKILRNNRDDECVNDGAFDDPVEDNIESVVLDEIVREVESYCDGIDAISLVETVSERGYDRKLVHNQLNHAIDNHLVIVGEKLKLFGTAEIHHHAPDWNC